MIRVNFQPMQKADRSDDGSLLVHSVFWTIQGEGPNAGKRAVFLRLGGCNLECPGCDTEYTNGSFRDSVDEIMRRISIAHGSHTTQPCLVVITGGEPFRQNILPLVNKLIVDGYTVQVETNGTLGLNLSHVTRETFLKLQVVCSPKAAKVHESLHHFITAYKYVVNADDIDFNDGLPLSVLGMPARPARPHADFEGTVYVQPAEEKSGLARIQDLGLARASANQANTNNLNAAIDSVMQFGHTLCLQTHKIAGLE